MEKYFYPEPTKFYHIKYRLLLQKKMQDNWSFHRKVQHMSNKHIKDRQPTNTLKN